MNLNFVIRTTLFFTLISISFGQNANIKRKYRENQYSSGNETISGTGDKAYGLKLTPFIRDGKLKQAKQLSRVVFGHLVSYSGFLSVNTKSCDSNIFFWFFPALNDSKSAPLILWHGGGPGSSGLVGLFTEHGPFYLNDPKGPLLFRNATWTENQSVIYLDSPVGTGFSYTKDDDCYCESSADTARDVYDFLVQFFHLFPEFKQNDLFISSGSYGGKFVPAIGYKIHLENQLLSANKQSLKINLKGLTISGGFTDPINQIDYGDFYYGLGLISEESLSHFKQEEEKTRQFILQKDWEKAFITCESLVIGCCFPNIQESYFSKVTGFSNSLNLLFQDRPPGYHNHETFVKNSGISELLHAGNITFVNSNNYVYEKLKTDIYQSLRSLVEELLNAEYKILIYSGQMDLIVPHTTVTKYVNALEWKQKELFHKSERKIWLYPGKEIAGYARSGGGLTYVLFRNAGHKISQDQPIPALHLITKFTREKFEV